MCTWITKTVSTLLAASSSLGPGTLSLIWRIFQPFFFQLYLGIYDKQGINQACYSFFFSSCSFCCQAPEHTPHSWVVCLCSRLVLTRCFCVTLVWVNCVQVSCARKLSEAASSLWSCVSAQSSALVCAWAMLQPCPGTLHLTSWHHLRSASLLWTCLATSDSWLPWLLPHGTWSWPVDLIFLFNLGPALLPWTCLVDLWTSWTFGWPWLLSLNLLCSSCSSPVGQHPWQWCYCLCLPCCPALGQSPLPQGSVAIIFLPV